MRVIFTFPSLHLVLKAEKLLREADDRRLLARATATPPGLSSDICGMSIELLEPAHKNLARQYLEERELMPQGVYELDVAKQRSTGLIIGDFAPLHRGHIYLLDFASAYCDTVYVLVTSKDKSIDLAKRIHWLKAKRPHVRILNVEQETRLDGQLDSHLDNQMDAPSLKATLLKGAGTERVDYLFSGNLSDKPLADNLGAQFIPVDPLRQLTKANSAAIRRAPLKHWSYLPEDVRLHYLKRVCIFGPESTGKSTLTANLANHFETVHVPEYARTLMETIENALNEQDLPIFAHGMQASEEALAHRANRVIFSDTDALTTIIWSEWLYQRVDPAIEASAAKQNHDLYLLLDVDVPWVTDPQRHLPEERETFLASCKQKLSAHGRPYVLISGTFEERLQKAIQAVEDLLKED